MPSKLCLGTVQFGLKYGINNAIGRQPNQEETFELLKTAIELCITTFDTASVYGNAERLLGDFNIGTYSVKIISKLKPNIMDNVVDSVKKEVEASLIKLNLRCIDGYILHNAKDFYRKDIITGLQICKEKNLIKNIGVSIYEPEDAINVVKSGLVDYIQVPYNVFDQRLNETDFFELADTNGVKVFARSVFLQGLLLMDIDKLPKCLSEAKPYLEKFNDIVKECGYTRDEAAFLFSYCNPHIYKVVFGVDTKEQLENNIKLIEKKDDFQQCYNNLYNNFKNVARKVIIPSLWK